MVLLQIDELRKSESKVQNVFPGLDNNIGMSNSENFFRDLRHFPRVTGNHNEQREHFVEIFLEEMSFLCRTCDSTLEIMDSQEKLREKIGWMGYELYSLLCDLLGHYRKSEEKFYDGDITIEWREDFFSEESMHKELTSISEKYHEMVIQNSKEWQNKHLKMVAKQKMIHLCLKTLSYEHFPETVSLPVRGLQELNFFLYGDALLLFFNLFKWIND